jgi:ATP-dependent RNA helicase SUPV3L1/SUV3
MEEDTQEPSAPEGAPSAPSVEPPAVEAIAAPTTGEESAASSLPEASVPVDWSHLRGLRSVEAPSQAWAARDDYATEFAKELSTRAARFVRSVDDSIVLSSDGVMRWLGDPVARLVAGEKPLAPRTVLLASDALAGEEREAAQNRAALWLAAHVRKLLGPLIALEEGAELPEAARSLGAKVGEALGVLDRERVRNEVRALDQTTRGAFRKLGVRFGSLYIYVPQLLKPGPRGLCTQLWMLMRGAEAGADQLLAFASAGRTSFGNDGALSPEAYRVAGFRLCGERVVRVDIVERLSDLIRAAMPDAMRGGSRAPSEGHGFLVTPQMTSLTGCSGEAFASILRSLNFEPIKVSKAAFEAARRKAPTEPIKPAAEALSSETVETATAEESAVGEAPNEPDAQVAESDAAAESEEATVAEAHVEAAGESADAEPIEAAELEAEPAAEGSSVEPPQEPLESQPASNGASATTHDASVEEASVAETAKAEALDEEIEIWRPARRQRAPQRPPRAERSAAGPNRRPQRAPEAERPAAAAAEAAPAEPQRRRDESPRRFEGKGDKRHREDRNRDERREFTPRRDSRPADPDSPFAKLAALKPLLEQRDKRN